MNVTSWRLAGLLLVVVTAATRLVPAEYRLLNFAAIGAVMMFATARLGWWAGLALAGSSMLLSDLVLWQQNRYDADYLPMPSVYVALLGYALLAWRFLRHTENPVKIAGVAIAGSVVFFIVTNFASWLAQALPYGYTPAGLLQCYQMAVPFYRGTLIGDLLFAGFLFGTHSVLVRAMGARPIPSQPLPEAHA
jgi:hypothetical protein